MSKKVQTDLFGKRMPDFVEPEFDVEAPKPKKKAAPKKKVAPKPKQKVAPVAVGVGDNHQL